MYVIFIEKYCILVLITYSFNSIHFKLKKNILRFLMHKDVFVCLLSHKFKKVIILDHI